MLCSKAAILLFFIAYCVFVNVPLFVYGVVFFLLGALVWYVICSCKIS